jgi:hypothetical protein
MERTLQTRLRVCRGAAGFVFGSPLETRESANESMRAARQGEGTSYSSSRARHRWHKYAPMWPPVEGLAGGHEDQHQAMSKLATGEKSTIVMLDLRHGVEG